MTAVSLLAALALGISHSPAVPQGCAYTIPVLADSPPPVMAGNLRTTDGGCLIWLSVRYSGALRRKDVCQLASHEAAHLAGLQHSPDPNALMYSPFRPVRRSYC